MIGAVFQSMRPKQWVKNFLLFAGLIFSQNLHQPEMVLKTLLAFVLFCFLSSGVYILNDIIDLENDKRHPIKSKRPIPSGRLSVPGALSTSVFLILFSLAVSFYLNFWFGITAFSYLILNIVYTFYLKHLVIIDVMSISLGFVLRAVAGALAIGVSISSWLIVCTILLALFLGFGKRRHELVLLEDEAHSHRRILSEYSPYFLDQMISVVTASTVVAYAFYTLSPEVKQKLGTPYMDLTIPFVLYGIFRYLYLIHQKEGGGSPTKMLLTDKPILINIILWLVAVFLILYL